MNIVHNKISFSFIFIARYGIIYQIFTGGAVMAIIKLCITFLLSITQMLAPLFSFMAGGIDKNFEDWSKDDKFERSYCFEIEKDPDKDFKVLNLTDIQLSPDLVFSERGEFSERLIDKLIKETEPDLITLTGDNSTSLVGYLRLIEVLDSYGIPWAPVMGNHDGGNGNKLQEAWDSYHLEKSENCLFKFGPKDMGYGNYIINITENGKIVHSLFMMDTHSGAGDTEASKINAGKKEDGSYSYGYDHLWANQIEWYKWAVNGIKEIAGETVESTVYFHIPVCEYQNAKALYTDPVEIGKNDEGKPVYKYVAKDGIGAFGELREGICSPEGNNGFFTTCVELGSTKTMVAGHDHVNSLCVNYQGINLCYGIKSGKGSYYDDDCLGGSVLSINSDGNASFEHHFYSESEPV